MSDVLAIVDQTTTDEQLVDEIVRKHGDRVTLLVAEEDAADDASEPGGGRTLRERIPILKAAIERTGAVVVGLAGSWEQLSGWRFDRIIGQQPLGQF